MFNHNIAFIKLNFGFVCVRLGGNKPLSVYVYGFQKPPLVTK